MSGQSTANLFAAAAIARNRGISSNDHELVIRQKPAAAKVFIGKEKDRKPIDPPPIIQLRISESIDPAQNYLQSPYYFVSSSLLDGDENRPQAEKEEVKSALAGTLVSSLHRLKDTDNNDGGFFVFGDLSVKIEGFFKLQFTLYEVCDKEVAYIKSIVSEPFQVYASKNWPGMAESTFLTRSFSDQGVRLRLRKEPRFRLGPRGPASDNYEPRHYNIQRRRPSQGEPLQSSQSGQRSQAMFSRSAEAYGSSLPPSQGDYSGSSQSRITSKSPGTHGEQRKRGFSQSSHSGSYGSHGDEPSLKRPKNDPEQSSQQPPYTQPFSIQHPSYSGRPFSESPQAPQYAIYPQHSGLPIYSGGYTQSPQSTPRDQAGFFTGRRADPFPSISPQYEPSTRPLPSQSQTHAQRSPTLAFNFAPPPAPMHSQYPLQAQYIPQLAQPTPPNRGIAPIGPPYPATSEHDQVSLGPRTGMLLSSEMPPPIYGRPTGAILGSMGSPSANAGVGVAHLLSPLPSTSVAEASRSWLYNYEKPRDDNIGR